MYGTRICLAGLLAGAIAAGSPAVAEAGFGIESWFAATCNATHESCEKAAKPSEEVEKAHEEGYAQAAGHPPFGITDFRVNTEAGGQPQGAPVTHIRVDVAPGLSTDPQAVAECKPEEFGTKEVVEGVFAPPTCKPETVIGENKVVVYVEGLGEVELHGTVYNLEPPVGRASEFGVAIELPVFLTGGIPGLFAHTLIEGDVEWGAEPQGTGKADYHDFFEINVSPKLPLIKSRLIFKGNAGIPGKGGFITVPTACTGVGPQTTTTIQLSSQKGEAAEATYTTPIGAEGCGEVPFAPAFRLKPETSQSDLPDGITTELEVPHSPNANEIDAAQLKTAVVTLPEGMTLNPSAARGLQACTPAQIAIHTTNSVTCPASSKLGTVAIDTPDLPPGSLQGNIYLGGPPSGPITGPPYIVYLDAESARYGVSVRIKGEALPNAATGQVTTIFSENPEQPLGNAILSFNGGALAPVANPLTCASATTSTVLTPFTSPFAPSQTPSSSFTVGGCPSPLPFSLAQSASGQPATAGAFGNTSYTFNLNRGDGQQYLAKVTTVLPAGLVGAIPAVTLCGEPQASLGACPASSKIGTAAVTAGAGAEPYPFSGPMYLTGPYGGGPFGLSIPIAAVAGPFDLGSVVTRAAINVDPHTARVSATSALPTIVGGVPIRLRSVSVAVNRPNFLYNPTNCGLEATESAFTSTFGASEALSSPFQVSGCGALAFTPKFTAATSANTSKANGASLHVNVVQAAHEANIRSVVTALPVQLPSRLTTLQQACPEATYAANPFSCPAGSSVGTATATTPVLPGTLSGPALLVSHGGAAFPDLDILLEGSGVRVILVGNTNIKGGITTTTFATLPDVPVSSFSLDLPTGPHSALAANADLCARPLLMPTTITGQNGARIVQTTRVAVAGCAHRAGKARVRILRRRIVRHTLVLTVQTSSGGRLTARGKYLKTVSRRVRTRRTTLKVRLSRRAVHVVARHHRLKVRVRIAFVASPSSAGRASAATAVTFKR
ncbi:MAG: hypothetical protein E6G34_00350 [Actinobacteria bacterium]|nr:MAG: hypothetical protein E6G34_00350 [Actinomycetota bacterium]